jgi:hypothetical protein
MCHLRGLTFDAAKPRDSDNGQLILIKEGHNQRFVTVRNEVFLNDASNWNRSFCVRARVRWQSKVFFVLLTQMHG